MNRCLFLCRTISRSRCRRCRGFLLSFLPDFFVEESEISLKQNIHLLPASPHLRQRSLVSMASRRVGCTPFRAISISSLVKRGALAFQPPPVVPARLTVICFLAGGPSECSLAGVALVPPLLRLHSFPAEVEVLIVAEAANFFSP